MDEHAVVGALRTIVQEEDHLRRAALLAQLSTDEFLTALDDLVGRELLSAGRRDR